MAVTTGQEFAYTFVVQGMATPEVDHDGYAFAISGGSGVAEIVYYLMRGTDAGLTVYWYATTIDTDAAEYPGVGPVTNIKLIKRKQ